MPYFKKFIVLCFTGKTEIYFLSTRNPGEDEYFGILEEDFFTVRHDWKLRQLQEIMPILSK